MNKWGLAILSIVLLISFSAASVYIVCVSKGYCRQSTILASDTKIITTKPTNDTNSSSGTTQTIVESIPVRMLIPAVNLGVDIADSTIDLENNVWPLSMTTAHYANFTPKLGDKKGTMLIYGHNIPAVMFATKDLTIGDELILVDSNNKSWDFTYVRDESVLPENTGVIYEDVPFRIVVFTCSGWNNVTRRLMYFSPIA